MSKLVTVCVASYNHGRFLPGLLESLLNQTYENIELVIVDDCSSDDSWQILENYKSRLDLRFSGKVKILRQQTNSGASQTAELATSLATGEYLSILESDDFYYPTKIAENVRFLDEHSDYAAVHSDFDGLEEQGRLVRYHWRTNGRGDSSLPDGVAYFIPSGWIRNELLANNFIGTLTFMSRRDEFYKTWLFSTTRAQSYMLGDYVACLRLSKISKIGYIDKSLACYRILSNSMTHDPVKRERVIADTERIKKDAATGII